ncbi:nicotinate (nicotinamide) nucleotide adenylyltransferase [Polytolypa hystricis UAMH7299]|uniref:Nicotinamide-nucleotide adenylyltransferase n=1 Tax=Polytolypa hystricis (strain UAMH7299) TaxID=1447883 RepID=A0A2B7Z1G5_POLH7|nr:nicotinate (nicotinamide) nucleotide adenylyltransferase [Polytolypa hystricis UAMH7299]
MASAGNDSKPTLPSHSHEPETSEMTTDTYQFPSDRLQTKQHQPDKTPLVLVACGSFSPITYQHLRMFPMASDFVRFNTDYEVMGCYLSPVSDAYKKIGLAPACHRIEMSELAVKSSDWIMVDPWEAIQPEYVPTAKVLDHFEYEINTVMGGVEDVNGNKRHVKISLLAGADLIQTMSTPGLWAPRDLDHILSNFGTFIIERAGTDIDEALASLKQWEDQIYYIPQIIPNDISSTKIRLLLKRNMSIDYLIPGNVIKYIKQKGLYQEEDSSAGKA